MSSVISGSACPRMMAEKWMDTGLNCVAGKREYSRGRYEVVLVKDGHDFSLALKNFLDLVRKYDRVAMFCVFPTVEAEVEVIDEYTRLAWAMSDAGLTSDPEALIDGTPLQIVLDIACPVTSRSVPYSFYPVCFTRNASNPEDNLFDPALAAPMTAINVTSDAFSLAMFARDRSLLLYEMPPHELDRERCEKLFRWVVGTWNRMSDRTITSYGGLGVPSRARLSVSDDGMWWIAPHNDPVFAERRKALHRHEMPIQYATKLASKWMATLFDGATLEIGSEGQSGGFELDLSEEWK